jgi:prolyl-tRNA editing enzyme YbaK/EbsC (Cys-tRNA(Pro) deacylase)
MNVSKRAQQFQDTLHRAGLNLTVLELPASTRTADDAARALNCAKAQIVKSLVFRDSVRGDPLLVLASGPNRVDEKILAQLVGGKVEKADADFVKEVTGYAIGGVPPIGHSRPLTVFVDEDLLKFEETWAAAGTPQAVFKIPGKITDILPAHRVIAVK